MEQQFSLTHLSRPPLEKGSGAVPMLILLHGVGSNEEDLMGLAGYFDPRWHIISARAPRAMGYQQYGWFTIHWDGTRRLGIAVDEARESVQLLLAFFKELQNAYGTEASQLYLVGFSQGAIISSAILLSAPEAVGGAVLMSGRYGAEIAEQRAAPERLNGKPVLVVHGLYDEVITIDEGRALRDSFAGLPVALEYGEFPMGHSVTAESVERVNQWLNERLKD